MVVCFLREKIAYFSRSHFIRQTVTLQAGSFAGNVIQAGIGIVIARLLQPELFGIYALAVGLASMTSLIMGMGIQEAVSSLLGRAYARKNAAEIEDIFGFMWKITFLSAAIVVAVLFFMPDMADKLYGNSLIGIYASIVAIAAILSSLFFTLSYSSFQVTGRIKSLATLIVSDQSLRYGLSLILIVAGWGVAGAVSGQLAGAFLVSIFSFFLFRGLKKQEPLFPDWGRLLSIAKRASIKKYFGFTFWVALDRNMGNIFMSLPVILTGIYAAASEVSFFKLAFGYVNLAVSLLGPVSVLLNVKFPKMQVENNNELYRSFKKVSLYSLGLSIVLTTGAIIVSPIAFKLLYGESFLPSVKYIFGLIIYGGLMGIGVGLGPMWRAINKVKVSIGINSVILAAGIPLGLWLIKNYGLWGSVVMVTIWFVVSHLISYFYIAGHLKHLK